jgi:arylsulfatase A-like enzyme
MVVDALKKEGLFENTIIIVSSDNGPQVKQGYLDGALENLNGHDPFGGLRGHKATIYEGGLRVPYIFSYPAVVKRGRVENKPVNLSNLIPTIAALTGEPLPDGTWKDAQDDSKIYLNKKDAVENPLFLQHGSGGPKAVRYGGWKYIKYPNGQEELFNLNIDDSETTNVIDGNPAKKEELKTKLNEFIERKYN